MIEKTMNMNNLMWHLVEDQLEMIMWHSCWHFCVSWSCRAKMFWVIFSWHLCITELHREKEREFRQVWQKRALCGSDWHQMRQIWGFLRLVLCKFSLDEFLKKSIFLPFGYTLAHCLPKSETPASLVLSHIRDVTELPASVPGRQGCQMWSG